MPTYPRSPFHLRGALVAIDPTTTLPSVILFQYNPTTLSRSLEVKNGEGGGIEALRIHGAPVETIKLEAELDATDKLEWGDASAVANGLHSQLAALELLTYPKSSTVIANAALLAAGAMEIVPAEGRLILFVWGPKRVLPVQITELSITEDAYDAMLNPIRAKVSLGLRVLSYNDFSSGHMGHALFLANQVAKEVLAKGSLLGALGSLSLSG
jgi:hypothetical protein